MTRHLYTVCGPVPDGFGPVEICASFDEAYDCIKRNPALVMGPCVTPEEAQDIMVRWGLTEVRGDPINRRAA